MDTLEQILLEELQTMIADIIRLSEQAGQRASGRTYERIVAEVQSDGPNNLLGAVYAPSYFYTLLRGRGPGKIPADLPDIIMEWAQYKGISFATPEEMIRFARATAYKIKREGSGLFRNHEYVDLLEEPIRAFEERLEARVDGIIFAGIDSAFNEMIIDFKP